MISHHRIPADAQCVFHGIRADIYQKNQEMYDGTYRTFEYVRYLDGAFTIPILKNKKILLTLQEQPGRQPFYSFPGGSVDFALEEPIACAKRELLEETGHISPEWKDWFRYDGTGNVMTYTHYYIAQECEYLQPISPDPGEKIEMFEVSFDELLALSSDPRLHHHWNLLPLFYDARLSRSKYDELFSLFYN